MAETKDRWSQLSMKQRADLIKLYTQNGITDLKSIRRDYNEMSPIIDRVNSTNTSDAVARLKDPNREVLHNEDGTVSTHSMSWATDENGKAIVYPEVQSTSEGLKRFRNDFESDNFEALDRAIERRDTIQMTPSQADWFTKYYKPHYETFNSYSGEENIKDHTIGEEGADSSFNVNWYKGRAPQLRRAIRDSYDAKRLMSSKERYRNYKKMTNDELVQSVTANFKDRLSSVKEFTTKEALSDYDARNILTQDYYESFPNEMPIESKDFVGPSKPVPNNRLEPTLRRRLIKGTYYPRHNTILYDSIIGDDSTKIHERTHATVNKFSPILKEVYDVVNELKARGEKIHYHYDDPEEIYARLMSFREKHGLDPTKTITEEDINNWKKSKVEDFDLINRYPVDILLRLFNDVAQNITDPNKLDYINLANIAAYGGRILDGTSEENQTLNNEPIYYDFIEPSIVKAFNSKKDYNRYKGKQFGKKVTKGINEAALPLYEGIKFAPIIGDAIDATEAGIAAKQGNYKHALSLAGLALLPNVLEKPIKHLKKGVKNLLTYRKYASQPERLRRSVDEIVDRYVKNAEVINANYGGTPKNRVINTGEDLINANSHLGITTNYKPFSRKKGGVYNGDIWVNPYGKGRLRKAWFSPKEAIKDLHGTAGHEGTHFALDVLNDKLAIYDKSRKYYKANPNHPLYQDVGYIFDDLNRTADVWERSPEEFIAEMNKFRTTNNIPNHLGYNQWKPHQKRMAQTALSNRFKLRPSDASYIAPEDINYILSKYADFGYKYGGKLTKKCK